MENQTAIAVKKRVGMTTNPDKRKGEWQSHYPNLHNWQIVATGLTYEQAQEQEFVYIKAHGYDGHPGGDYAPGYVWSVYTFEY